MSSVHILPVEGIPEIAPGDDLGAHIVDAVGPEGLHARDVVVIAHKVVSKSEGRLVAGADRRAAALKESVRILRRLGDTTICETRHGFVCANAGVDASNVPDDKLALLPLDPDLSARRIRARVRHLSGVDVAVVISDTFGRAWRLGQTNVAIGVAGINAFIDYRGQLDAFGKQLTATRICTADEIAGAAELVMRKATGICAVIVRGAPVIFGPGAAADIVRPAAEDLFR